MKRSTRLVSALIAAALSLSAFTVTVGAAAEEMLSLITAPLISGDGKYLSTSPLGADLFSAVCRSADSSGICGYSETIYRADEDAIDEWRDSGTLTLPAVEVEGYPGEGIINFPCGISGIHDYACVMMPLEDARGGYGMAALRYDRKAGRLERYYTAEEMNIGVAAWNGVREGRK